jgi:hypothetical protein
MCECDVSGWRGTVDAAGSRRGWHFTVLILLFVWTNPAALQAAPAPPTASAVEPRVSALLHIADDKEANVVAVIAGSGWQSAGEVGGKVLKRLAKRKPVFQVFPSADWESEGPRKGNLSGRMRAKCGDYYFGLAGRTVAPGFAAVNTAGDPVPPVQLQQVAVKPDYTKAVAELIARVAKVKVAPTIERAYSVDLDGNGKPEIILQATHPDLNGDPPDYKPEYYSLIVVLPDAAGVEPVFTGYLQAAKDWESFEVLTFDSVADVDSDGKRELLVRSRYEEGWQTQVFRYDGKLEELFRSVGGEGECPRSSE